MARAAERNGAARHRVLIVEDEGAVSQLLSRVLTSEGYVPDIVESGEAALQRLQRELYDVVLLDLHLPKMGGMEVLSAAPALQTDAQFIMMTSFGTVDTAVEAMKRGAFDYLNKPFRTEELLLILQRAIRDKQLRRESAQVTNQPASGVRKLIIGDSPAMARVFELVERVAPMKASVLITGETGTGKELIARAVHDLSERARGPFVAVNCSALPETLLESELFGHTKGSFTGAIADKRGLFEEAHGGTLFLDEIATVSAAIQVKLLRVLQEKQVKRVGGTREVPVDFRLVAATNRELADEVEAGRFRADLNYRLNVFPIRIPALRERTSDIPLLANHFRGRFAKENGIEPPQILPESLERMMAHEWPGNVRELENFVERALIMHAGAPWVPFEAVPGKPLQAATAERVASTDSALLDRADEEAWSLERLEREHILRTLERTGGHRANAAAILGINRRTLFRKLAQYEAEGVLPEHLVAHDAGEPPRLAGPAAPRTAILPDR
jgi:two-component system, NtrC family, response regulator PilR